MNPEDEGKAVFPNPELMTTSSASHHAQQHQPELPSSGSSGSLDPTKTPVNSSGSSASSFLPPIFGGERDSSRSGSDSAESRSDFIVATTSSCSGAGVATTSGWSNVSRGASVTRNSESTSHSDSPSSIKSPTKLPRLDSSFNASHVHGSGVFSPDSAPLSSNYTTPRLTPRLTSLIATVTTSEALSTVEDTFSSPEPDVMVESLAASDPLMQLFLQSKIGQHQSQQHQQLFGGSNTLRLPAIDPDGGGSSPRFAVDPPPGVESLPPHLHQTKQTGVKRKHKRRRKGSEMSTSADASLQQSQQLCQDENHFQHGLCEQNAPCYVTAAEAFARSGGFSLPDAFIENEEDAAKTMTTTRVEFDLPTDADSEDSPQNRFHNHPKSVGDVDCSDDQSHSLDYADDEMVSNESPHYSDAGTPLDPNSTPTPQQEFDVGIADDLTGLCEESDQI